jgi:hypothetical protein
MSLAARNHIERALFFDYHLPVPALSFVPALAFTPYALGSTPPPAAAALSVPRLRPCIPPVRRVPSVARTPSSLRQPTLRAISPATPTLLASSL